MQYKRSTWGLVMNNQKNSTLTLRIDPAFKQGLKAAAEQEHRSITNMVEVLIRDYCHQHNIELGQDKNQAQPSGR